MDKTYNAHNAIDDVSVLYDLWLKIKPQILKKVGSNIMTHIGYYEDWKLLESTFQELIEKEAISKAMATKAAKSGLCVGHLKKAIERDSLDGLTALLSLKRSTGKARVTATKYIIKRIFESLDTK